MHIPEQLLLGAATAAYQIEGAVHEDGRGVSIWDTYSHTPGRILTGETGDVTVDHYHRLEQDLDLMASLGLQAYRFSVAWPRVIPQGAGAVNQRGLDFYSRLVDGLLERGIEPVATLYHWDLPQPLEDAGGWPARTTADAFARYAHVVGSALGDRVHTWGTFNEPWGSAYLGYAAGMHAPGRTDAGAALRAVHHLNLAHGMGARALREVVRPDAPISVTLNLFVFRPVGERGEEAAATIGAIANEAFLAPMLEGRLSDRLVAATSSISDWSFVRDGDLEIANAPIDALGVNYYRTIEARMAGTGEGEGRAPGPQFPGADDVELLPATGPLTDMGWNIDPSGLTELLVGLHARFPKLALLVTENGAAFSDVVEDGAVHDARRRDYLYQHVRATLEAMQQGADVRGYYVWTLLDNFEWSFGTSKRFGLIHVDYDTQVRTVKDSGHWYRNVIATRELGDLPA